MNKWNWGKSSAFLPGYGSIFGMVAGALINALKPLNFGMSPDEIVEKNKALIHDQLKGENSLDSVKLNKLF